MELVRGKPYPLHVLLGSVSKALGGMGPAGSCFVFFTLYCSGIFLHCLAVLSHALVRFLSARYEFGL